MEATKFNTTKGKTMEAVKTKRVKTVFSSNSQLCHVFAQQIQEEGRTKNMFFINTTELYSYGLHYLAAKVFNTKRGRVVLINDYNYSNSTSKQLREVWSSFRGLENVKMFHVPVPRSLEAEENEQHFNDIIFNSIDSILRTVKVTSQSSVDSELDRLERTVNEANEFFKLIGKPSVKVPTDLKNILKEHLEARFKRTKELDKGLEDRRKLEAEKQARKLQELNGRLPELKALWRTEGDQKTLKLIQSVENNGLDLFRVVGDRVVTSRAAAVPLKTALKVVRKLQEGTLKAGEAVEQFSVVRVDLEAGTVKVGCHCFSIREAVEVLRPYLENSLKLVD